MGLWFAFRSDLDGRHERQQRYGSDRRARWAVLYE
jgi:hypothetical protein